MENINLMNYITTKNIILIPVLYVLGTILKNTKQIKDWTIPYIVLALSVIIAFFLNGLNINSMLQGVLCTGITVYSNQLVKQTAVKRKEG